MNGFTGTYVGVALFAQSKAQQGRADLNFIKEAALD